MLVVCTRRVGQRKLREPTYSLWVLTSTSALSLVESLGPSVVLVFAVLLAAWLVKRGRQMHATESILRNFSSDRFTVNSLPALDVALDQAVTLNSGNVDARHEPSVRLQGVVRFSPIDYRSVVGEIATRFRARDVLSIDLTNMDAAQAIRLVDFCSGMAAICSGWIFRVTDKVIVLTPPG